MLEMDHTAEMDHTRSLFLAVKFCGSCHNWATSGTSSRPQLAGREVAFYTKRQHNLGNSFTVIVATAESCRSRGEALHQWLYFRKLVIYNWGSGKVLGHFARIRPSVSSLQPP
jgi:hypothetical protein